MSESEKAKRDEYQRERKRIIYILLSVALAMSVLFATFSIIFASVDAHTYVDFYEEGSVVYHAYLNDNEYYEEDRLNGDHAYVSSLIQRMDAVFKYRLHMNADDVAYKYQYRVDSMLVIEDAKTGAAIYNPVTNLLAPTSATYKGDVLYIDPKVDIDYVSYNEKAKAFIEKYKLTDVVSHLDVTMYVDVVGMSESFASDNEGQYTVTVRIPLNQTILKPQTSSTIPTGPQKVLAQQNEFKTGFKVIFITFGSLAVIAFAAVAIYFVKTRDEHIDYALKVKRIVNSYKGFIQRINTPFDETSYQVLYINTFNEMLEIRDTLQLPILMYENEDRTRSVFMIPTSTKLLYVFDIKVDNYDDIYGETSEEASVENVEK